MSELLDNRANRLRNLKRLIQQLHAGADPDFVRSQLKSIVQAVDATEIAHMEQELLAEGIPASQLTAMCDLHADILRDIITNPESNSTQQNPSASCSTSMPESTCSCPHAAAAHSKPQSERQFTPISNVLSVTDDNPPTNTANDNNQSTKSVSLPVQEDMQLVDEIRAHMPDRNTKHTSTSDTPPEPPSSPNSLETKILPGHPVDTFRKENDALADLMVELKKALSVLCEAEDAETKTNDSHQKQTAYTAVREHINQLMDIDKHYDRKENLLFSMLERHGITGPSTVMWAVDDKIRDLCKAMADNILPANSPAEAWQNFARNHAHPTLKAAVDMIFKEENILLPMALQSLTPAEWAEIWEQSPQFGWCLVDPQEGYIPPRFDAKLGGNTEGNIKDHGTGSVSLGLTSPAVEGKGVASEGVMRQGEQPSLISAKKAKVMFGTGMLTLEQMTEIFSTIPVDMTFVDAEDRVRFFSEGPKRVFKRPKAVIGRLVHHCHPPHSVHIVEKILDDFKSGRENLAEFWIQMGERFIHIRYYPLRDDAGEYMGTLEVTQDLTHERSLAGERRLLSYD